MYYRAGFAVVHCVAHKGTDKHATVNMTQRIPFSRLHPTNSVSLRTNDQRNLPPMDESPFRGSDCLNTNSLGSTRSLPKDSETTSTTTATAVTTATSSYHVCRFKGLSRRFSFDKGVDSAWVHV